MARCVRIEYPGALYHVMARGSRRERIYRDEAERRFFLQTLGEACQMTGWRVHAWMGWIAEPADAQCGERQSNPSAETSLPGCQDLLTDPFLPQSIPGPARRPSTKTIQKRA